MCPDVTNLLKRIKRLHFVGIGGSGMFPLVEILLKEGYSITGSDVNESSIVELERGLGIDVSIGHDAKNVGDAEALVVTAALLEGNPETEFAAAHGIPIIERAELLGWTTEHYSNAVCVCGTHGKTTTTSMVTSILLKAGCDPSAVIGGKLPLINGYGRHGETDILVCESCEFKDTFLHLTPDYAVILNIDAD
ncbi:MAG: UDP-N-acetylmuramate--L-alanine ligase, partial [Ruminococcaceae bacterium]|nr:UDP-N-acetylmuramate--L-alanine ligase [Oscillospiraceae bacterium]